jgi:tetratricopeptide (TPR) repeat protein
MPIVSAARHIPPAPTIGLALVALGLVLPWVHRSLVPGRHAWALPIVLAGLPRATWATYGLAASACLSVAAVATLRHRGRPSPAAAVAGALVLLAAVGFVVEASLADFRLTGDLANHDADLRFIEGQLHYKIPHARLDSFLVFHLDGHWRQVVNALRPGWLAIALGGVVLLASGWHTLRWSDRFIHITVVGLAVLLVGTLTAATTRAVFASHAMADGINANSAGSYNAALRDFRRAQTLNPQLPDDGSFQLAYGTALNASGQRHAPLALLADARVRGLTRDYDGRVRDLLEAHRAAPHDVVITTELRRVARTQARAQRRPELLHAMLADHSLDGPAERYTLGRLYFNMGSYQPAIPEFKRVIELTNDTNVRSSALTYIAISQQRLGLFRQGRRTLLRAIAADSDYYNTLARALAVGLYVPFKP